VALAEPRLGTTLRGSAKPVTGAFRIGRVFADTPQCGNVGAAEQADRSETWL